MTFGKKDKAKNSWKPRYCQFEISETYKCKSYGIVRDKNLSKYFCKHHYALWKDCQQLALDLSKIQTQKELIEEKPIPTLTIKGARKS